jgi:NAD(P)H-nitrite reductase large subunit
LNWHSPACWSGWVLPLAWVVRPLMDPCRVKLSTGAVIEADLVISATGVKPAMEFLEGSGVMCLQGVLTDETHANQCAGHLRCGRLRRGV